MGMTDGDFNQNITNLPSILEKYKEDLKLDQNQYNQLLRFRFAMGFVFGYFDSLDKSWGNKGPQGERAFADMHAIFYKKGNFDFGKPKCSWINQIPQGFSCGKASVPLKECDGFLDRYIPVDCNEILVKVADKRCQKFTQNENGQRIKKENLGNEPDCHVNVNWT